MLPGWIASRMCGTSPVPSTASISGISFCRSARYRSARHPVTTRRAPVAFFFSAISRMVSMDSCLARSMKAQVLTMTTSAPSASVVISWPACSAMPSITSESTRFLGQPRERKPIFTGLGAGAWGLGRAAARRHGTSSHCTTGCRLAVASPIATDTAQLALTARHSKRRGVSPRRDSTPARRRRAPGTRDGKHAESLAIDPRTAVERAPAEREARGDTASIRVLSVTDRAGRACAGRGWSRAGARGRKSR